MYVFRYVCFSAIFVVAVNTYISIQVCIEIAKKNRSEFTLYVQYIVSLYCMYVQCTYSAVCVFKKKKEENRKKSVQFFFSSYLIHFFCFRYKQQHTFPCYSEKISRFFFEVENFPSFFIIVEVQQFFVCLNLVREKMMLGLAKYSL